MNGYLSQRITFPDNFFKEILNSLNINKPFVVYNFGEPIVQYNKQSIYLDKNPFIIMANDKQYKLTIINHILLIRFIFHFNIINDLNTKQITQILNA